MRGKVEEKRLAEVGVLILFEIFYRYRVFLSKGDLYTLHLLKAFDFIDDDDSGFISKEVSESMHGQ